MAERDKIVEQKVKSSGVFDFKEAYQFVYRWLVDEGYKVEERKYQEVLTGDSKTVEIIWEATRNISDYFRNEIRFGWRITGLKTIEVDKGGNKIKMNSGSIEIKITGTLIKDRESRWEASPVSKFLRGVYDKYIIEGRVTKYEKKIFEDVDEITEQIKAFFATEGMK